VRDPGDGPPELRVELRWLMPWLPDPSCLPPIESADHAAVVAAGCSDPLGVATDFGFSVTADVRDDGTATLDLLTLPASTFGDTSGQIAYATIAIIDSVHGIDVVDGTSFASMATPDTRLAFRHGRFDDNLAFYPRRGCGAPPEGFSLVSAGGFSFEAASAAQARGELPLEDPASCREDPLDRVVEVALQPAEAGPDLCYRGATTFYLPPQDTLFPGEITACTSLRDRAAGRPSDRSQALVAQTAASRCRSLQHFLLRGCYGDPFCATPDWDVPPPAWWPCAPEPSP